MPTSVHSLEPMLLIEHAGHSVPDGALDIIRIPPGAAERYHVELDRGQRLRVSIAADEHVTLRVEKPATAAPPSLAEANGRDVDLFHVTLCAKQQAASLVIAIHNHGANTAHVAVFLRTLPPHPAVPTKPPMGQRRRTRLNTVAA